MGMYTELVLGVAFKKDTPQQIIDVLSYMVSDYGIKPVSLPDHPLFETEKWHVMLCCDSYMFDGKNQKSLVRNRINGLYHLTVRCNFKNYDDEIEKFINFIYPYLDTQGFIGYVRCEEDRHPILIYTYGSVLEPEFIEIH